MSRDVWERPQYTSDIRNLIRLRDNYTCQSCGLYYRGDKKNLHAHHLDKEMEGSKCPEWDKEHMDRLVTLCQSCHKLATWNIDTPIKELLTKKKTRKKYRHIKYDYKRVKEFHKQHILSLS